jgi:hypothetical protein
LDADDALLPRFVEQAHVWIQRPDCPDVILFDYEYRDSISNELLLERHFDHSALTDDAIRFTIEQQINNVGVYRRKSVLEVGGFDLDPNVLYNEDVAYHTRLAQAGLRFGANQTVSLVMYRKSNSMSRVNRSKCCRAQYYVMLKCAERVSNTHGREIADRFWRIAACAAMYEDWQTADECIRAAVQLFGRLPPSQNPVFAGLCFFSPRWALWFREHALRFFRPDLRRKSTD